MKHFYSGMLVALALMLAAVLGMVALAESGDAGLPDVNECIVTKEAVNGGRPTLISGVGKRTARCAEKKADETDAS